jgi:hypothetical protein
MRPVFQSSVMRAAVLAPIPPELGEHFPPTRARRGRRPLDRARGVLVRADLERVLALQLEEERDLLERAGDIMLVHVGIRPIPPGSGEVFEGRRPENPSSTGCQCSILDSPRRQQRHTIRPPAMV